MLRNKLANFYTSAKTFGIRALNTYNKFNSGLRDAVKHASTARDVYNKFNASIAGDETVPLKVRQTVNSGQGYIDVLHRGIGRGHEIQQNFDTALRKSLPAEVV